MPITPRLRGNLWESCIDLSERLKHHKKRKKRGGGRKEVKPKLNEKLLTYTSRTVWNIYYSESHGERKKRRRRIEERNPFGEVDADRWDWRQAGQSASEGESVCMCVRVSTCEVFVYPFACTRRPRLLFLIDPAQHPSDLQDISELRRGWWRWRDCERETARKKGSGERNIKINSAESIAQNLTGREAEIVKLY